MEARLIRTALLAGLLLVTMGARHQSANFVIETPDPAFAAQMGEAAEKYRHDLAVAWLGQAMPNWAQPCLMTVHVGANLGAGGATTFVFDRGEVFGWRMTIQGSRERLVDSVLPHEVTHTIFASYFRRPLPRWADEGGATSVECPSEKQKHRTMLVQFLRTGRGIPFSDMFAMTDYPRDVMPLYAQAHSLAEYLILHGGRRKYIEFLTDGLQKGDWTTALHQHYGIAGLGEMQNTWVNWVAQGFPAPKPDAAVVAASATAPAAEAVRRTRPEPNLIYHIPVNPTGGNAPAAASAVQTAGMNALPASPSQALPAEGWRASDAAAQPGTQILPAQNPFEAARNRQAAGSTTAAPQATSAPAAWSGPAQEQVSRPQPMEPSRQIILEWNQR